MRIQLKPIAEQVIVITGASSGIGLATAMLAAHQGARVVMAARSQETLTHIADQIVKNGGSALAVTADVARREDVDRIARMTLDRYGHVDTWINNAGLSIFGRLDEVPEEASQRLFQVNFWGVVHGSLAAVPLLKANQGGALINVGSEVSDASVPLQGMYSASKHAVKGFTDALRIELEADEAPISVTLIQPTAVDTPFPEHAANYMSQAPKLPTPMIEAEKVASAILDAATDPKREVRVGAMSVINTAMFKLLPGLADRAAKKQMGRQQRNAPAISRDGTLYRPGESGDIKGFGNSNAADPDDAMKQNTRPPV
ncbi:SDR family oxidoreductase [Bordetella genomosp. 9]|uniref:Short-chain dehydrogenase n=1 Tax=Bordetella genomosp. 9 TaxID=1416803 RepID=A0A1W6YWT9_9BORD|nr:SDR family oxidoreductase [Bordetella genomosp. 9]ARP85557.1 short-chain dehydrogenase [Bordetella genomosp. 9]ARP89532.1 short-chain dehydrogenase [Bordetella genomosp. 9]